MSARGTYCATLRTADGTRVASFYSSTENLARLEAIRYLNANGLKGASHTLQVRKLFSNG